MLTSIPVENPVSVSEHLGGANASHPTSGSNGLHRVPGESSPFTRFGAALLEAGATPANPPLRILIAEPLGPYAGSRLGLLGEGEAVITFLPDLKGQTQDELTARVIEALTGQQIDLLVVRGNTLLKPGFLDPLEPGDHPNSVLRAGTGMDNIDTNYLKTYGINAENTPHVNSQSTAEHAVGLMFAVCRQIPQADQQVKGGDWGRSKFLGQDLAGKTFGLIGNGKIGALVRAACQALGMRVIGFLPPSKSPEEVSKMNAEMPDYYLPPEEFFKCSDVVSVHVPLTEDTRGMIGAKELALMPKGGVVINTARGGIVDEQAILSSINRGHIAGYGCDVFERDPAPPDSVSRALAQHPQVVATPHIAGQTRQASELMGQAVADKARQMLAQRNFSKTQMLKVEGLV